MDSAFMRVLASQLEASAIALRKLADAQDGIQSRLMGLEYLDKPILEVLDLSVRSRKIVERLGAKTVRDLTRKSMADLETMRNCGATASREIQRALEKIGLSLRMDV